MEEEEDELEWEEWNPNKISFRNHMIAGSIAGLAEHVSLFPFDTIKTHVQCQKCGAPLTTWQTWSSTMQMIQAEGPFRLWRGVSATFAGCIPAHAAFFSVFEAMKRLTGADRAGHHPIGAAITGASAALSHDLFMTPFDTIKQRMQLGYYSGFTHCIREVLRTEGAIALFRSLPATLLMNIPHGATVVIVNESTRTFLRRDQKLSLANSMVAGSLAGAVAAMVTCPLDVIKTRLQTIDLAPCPAPSSANITPPCQQPIVSSRAAAGEAGHGITAMISIARGIFIAEGIKGLLRGLVPRMMTQAPAAAISWTAYEAAKAALL
jgi:solute carrier family 25 iron transporter 28/37